MNTTNVLNNKVLVLNKCYQPINIISAFHAICKVYTGAANIVDENYGVWTFDQWVNNWEDLTSVPEEKRAQLVHTAKLAFPAPEIIVTTKFTYEHHKVRLTRKNIFIRDQNTCQYCCKEFPSNELNIDHVVPSSRGGKTRWANVVASCIPCNTRKAARTPREANMPLLKTPAKPHWSMIAGKITAKVPKSWESFVDELYWNVELKN